MYVQVCTVWDAETETCTAQAWVPWPGVIPPLPAAQGVELSLAMWGVIGLAWSYKAIRRFVSPRMG